MEAVTWLPVPDVYRTFFVNLSEEVEDTIISRASLDVRMRTRYALTEYIRFIEYVSGGSTYSGTKDSPISDGYSVES